MTPSFQQTGRTAAAAGILMLVGVEGEWVLNPQADDGTVTNPPVFALLVLSATVGFALLLLAVRGLRVQASTTKAARVGALLSLAGAGLLVAFGLTSLSTALLTGSPLEAAFVAFLLGMLLLSVGPITWALSLRGPTPAPGLRQMLFLSGAAGLAALALEADPWHDLSLVVTYMAWTVLGVLLLRGGGHSAIGESGRTVRALALHRKSAAQGSRAPLDRNGREQASWRSTDGGHAP